jgi:hypothetical protein
MAKDTYATLTEIKGALKKTTDTDDAALLLVLKAATRTIDRFCNRPDGFLADASASARLYAGNGGPILWVDECVEVDTVAVKDSPTETTYTAWNSDDWIAFAGDPKRPDFQPLQKGKPYTAIMASAVGDESLFTSGRYSQLSGFRPSFTEHRGVPTVQVTAKWGYSVLVPDVIREACIVQSARWFRRGLSQWSDTIGSPDFGQLMYRQPLDPALQLMLVKGGFKRAQIG